MEKRSIETVKQAERRVQHKILVIDDDSEMRLAMNIRLKANDYAVGFAGDGVSGLALARLQRPDVILLDLGLPAGDGYAVLEWLQTNETLACIPVIVVTGRDRAANQGRSLKAGARIFLQKPVYTSALLSAIESVLGIHPPPAPIIYNLAADPARTTGLAWPGQNIFKAAA